MTTKLRVRKKGGPGSGYHGHAGRPGLEGGAIPKGGSRRVYGTGKRTASFPKGKTIPPVPKIRGGRVTGIPEHVKGDTSGAGAFKQWKSGAGSNVSEADDVRMKSWFGARARAMEFNASIPTVVPGQRDGDEEEKEPKKKEPEKDAEKPKKGKGKKKGKVTAKKKAPKAKAPAKPKKAKIKKKGPTPEERAKVLKAVGVKPDIYNTLKKAEETLKAGDTLSWKDVLLPLMKAGLMNVTLGRYTDPDTASKIMQGLIEPTKGLLQRIRMPRSSQALIRAIEKGDAIAAQRVMDNIKKAGKKK